MMFAQISGTQMAGISANGSSFHSVYKTDGTVFGSYQHTSGQSSGTRGTWKIDDSGRVCSEIITFAWNTKNSYCRFVYRLADKYFLIESDADKASAVSPQYSITKE